MKNGNPIILLGSLRVDVSNGDHLLLGEQKNLLVLPGGSGGVAVGADSVDGRASALTIFVREVCAKMPRLKTIKLMPVSNNRTKNISSLKSKKC